MVNYDLPWNPNRIEQRFGRIHRIGQDEVCRLWNLVAANTREGEVFTRLLEKIEELRKTYGGKVFDVLGEAFSETPLRDLLSTPSSTASARDVKAKMHEVIDASVGDGSRSSSKSERSPPTHLAERRPRALRAAMDEARARRLQPHYIELAFKAAFTRLGGRIVKREQGRYEIANVPAHVRASRHGPIATRYDRVTFDLDRTSTRRPALAPTCSPRATRSTTPSMDEAIRQFGGSPRTRHRPRLVDARGAAPAGRCRRGGRRRHRRVRRPAVRLRLRRQLRHGHASRPGAVPRLRRGPRRPGRRRGPSTALARGRRGQGDELDHRQPAPRVPRRGPAAPRAPSSQRPATWSTSASKESEPAPPRRRGRRGEGAGRREAEGVLRRASTARPSNSTRTPQAPGTARPAGSAVDQAAAHPDRGARAAGRHARERDPRRRADPRQGDQGGRAPRRRPGAARERELGRKPGRAGVQQPRLRHPLRPRRAATLSASRSRPASRAPRTSSSPTTRSMTGKNAVPRYRLALVKVDSAAPSTTRSATSTTPSPPPTSATSRPPASAATGRRPGPPAPRPSDP